MFKPIGWSCLSGCIYVLDFIFIHSKFSFWFIHPVCFLFLIFDSNVCSIVLWWMVWFAVLLFVIGFGRGVEMGQIQYSEKYADDAYEYRSVNFGFWFFVEFDVEAIGCVDLWCALDFFFFCQRHVVLPPEVAKLLPKNRLLSEVISLSDLSVCCVNYNWLQNNFHIKKCMSLYLFIIWIFEGTSVACLNLMIWVKKSHDLRFLLFDKHVYVCIYF